MPRLSDRHPQNIEGNFFVDSSCIDCDTCRWLAPHTFHAIEGQSAVFHQPQNARDRLQALQALLACPTASIGTVQPPSDIKTVQAQFPLPIEGQVFYCGYHSPKSYAAASYFIQHPEGNILVDSPRFAPPLVKRLEELGGIRYLYLTHRDDVADHQAFHDHFGCDRLLHEADLGATIAQVEHPLSGYDPIALSSDLLIIPVPGHTQGHTVLLFQNQFLFTGDHLAWSERLQHLYAFRDFCWYSWPQLVESMEKLATYTFEWVLPGHGRRYHADPATMQAEMQKCLTWLRSQ